MSPGAQRFRPGLRGQAIGHRCVEQAVPRGVKVHLVNSDALWRVGVQDRGIAVCLFAPQLRFDTAGERAEILELAKVLFQAPALESLTERGIGQDDVVLRKRGGLVSDLVSAHLREAMRLAPSMAGGRADVFHHPGARSQITRTRHRGRLDSRPCNQIMSASTHSDDILVVWRSRGHSSVGRAQPCQG